MYFFLFLEMVLKYLFFEVNFFLLFYGYVSKVIFIIFGMKIIIVLCCDYDKDIL